MVAQVVNVRGIGESAKTNVVLAIVSLTGLAISVGAWAILQGKGDASRLLEINTVDSGPLLAITTAVSLAFFARLLAVAVTLCLGLWVSRMERGR